MARCRGDAVTDALDRLYLARACELAARGRGSTAPNPNVGAVLVRDGVTLGEGFHRMRGAPHAEAEALQNTSDARGATLYVSLEPCVERTLGPPCAPALRAAGIARVVVGALDPNPTNAGRGVALLREAGVEVELAEDARARALVEDFSVSIAAERPYVRLKLAASLDGYVAPQPGSHWLTGDAARAYVRELRVAHDAVMVGAGTVRVDDPQLIVRPPYTRRTPYRRIVVCEDAPVPADSKIFAPVAGYAPTLALAPRGLRERFEPLAAVAELLFAGDDDARTLDLVAALRELKRVGITSVLCEGGPTLAARLLEHGLVDRLDWLIAPVFLAGAQAVPALAPAGEFSAGLRFERVEMLGDDLLVSCRPLKGA